jgi:hypothetical protein
MMYAYPLHATARSLLLIQIMARSAARIIVTTRS